MAYGGQGLGRFEGKVIFVPGTIPGDLVEVALTKETKNYSHAELIRIESASPSRRKPPCSVDSECGGCQWQAAPYQQQIQWKQQCVEQALARIGKLSLSDNVRFFPASDEWHYRNRVRFRGFWNGDSFEIGFFSSGSHRLIDVKKCWIAPSAVTSLVESIRTMSLSASPFRFQLDIHQLSKEQQHQHVVTVFAKKNDSGANELVKKLKQLPEIFWGGLASDTDSGPYFIFDQQFGKKFFSKPLQLTPGYVD